MSVHISFVDRVLRGEINLEEIDDAIDAWHTTETGVPLHEYLGLTFEEYQVFVVQPSMLQGIVATRKLMSITTSYVITLLVFEATDLPGTWVSYCSNFDIVSQGSSVESGLDAVIEAVQLALEGDPEAWIRSYNPEPVHADPIYALIRRGLIEKGIPLPRFEGVPLRLLAQAVVMVAGSEMPVENRVVILPIPESWKVVL